MKFNYKTYIYYLFISILLYSSPSFARDITFCGEVIPINNHFVANKLMNVIRSQRSQVPLARLRADAKRWFPMIEYYLRAYGLPEDLKYIPIVESGFRNATSKVGAQGFWQLMEGTARDWNLRVDLKANIDERNDVLKATIAACQELRRLYKTMNRLHNVSSWTLSAAAYNFGSGNISNTIRKQGTKNYFSMNLNAETAVYVYKIIAIKELFEYPELYIKNFEYNVFKSDAQPKGQTSVNIDTAIFKSVEVKVDINDKEHQKKLVTENIPIPKESELRKGKIRDLPKDAYLVRARIIGNYSNFQDGDSIVILLEDKLRTKNSLYQKGFQIKRKGYIIDEHRVFVDMGFDGPEVILYDIKSEQGVALEELKDKMQLTLRVQKFND